MCTSKLKFPVLCLSKDSSIVVIENLNQLSTCSAVAFWKNNYYENLIIFDSNAEMYRVSSAIPEPGPGFLKLPVIRLFNRPIKVSLKLKQAKSSTLEKAKDSVIKWISKAPDFWESSYDLDTWFRQVRSCKSMKELIKLFK